MPSSYTHRMLGLAILFLAFSSSATRPPDGPDYLFFSSKSGRHHVPLNVPSKNEDVQAE
jgi:hypothetical protein